MTIRIASRASSERCPYCLDDVVQGVVCPACRARYHDECAGTFGRCAALGCGARFAPPASATAPLPRLRALAQRLARWRLPEDLAAGGWVVVLLPGPLARIEDPEAAWVVGELLGLTPYDGRLRLGGQLPEPLVRADDPATAEAVVERLAARRVDALAAPLAEVLAPLEVVEATAVDVSADPLVLGDARGGERWLPYAAPRLVVTATLVEERKAEVRRAGGLAGTTGRFGGGFAAAGRPTTRTTIDRRLEQAAFVFTPESGVPWRLRAFGLERLAGTPRGASATETFQRVLGIAARGADRVELPAAATQVLLNLSEAGRGGDARDNHAGVALAARLTWIHWRRARGRA